MLRIPTGAILLAGFVALTYAAGPELRVIDKACWIEIFEDDNYD